MLKTNEELKERALNNIDGLIKATYQTSEVEKTKLVIWKDETYKVCSSLDASQYENDENWFMTFDIKYLYEGEVESRPLDAPVMQKIVGIIDEKIKEIQDIKDKTPKNNMMYREKMMMGTYALLLCKDLKKKIGNNFSA